MTAAAKNAFGTELWLVPTGGTLVKIAELTTIGPPKRTRETEDVTTHDSTGGAMEFIAHGVYDSGGFSATGYYIAGDTNDDALALAMTSGAVQDFQIIAKAASGTEKLTGSAIITDHGQDEAPVKGVQTFSFTAKITGVTTQAAVA